MSIGNAQLVKFSQFFHIKFRNFFMY